MAEFTMPEGEPDIVNLREASACCFCGYELAKRRHMWKYPCGNYLCVFCKTRFDKNAGKAGVFTDGRGALNL